MIKRTVRLIVMIGLLLSFSLPAEAYIVTFYPDANPENTSVDGCAGTSKWTTPYWTWDQLRNDAGTSHNDSGVTAYACYLDGEAASNRWKVMQRGIILFDTSSLPDDAIISSAILSLYGSSKAQNVSWSPSVKLYASNPDSINDLVNTDYATLGSLALSDTAISYASWNTAGYNDFLLNAYGLTAISTTGISMFGTRSNYDGDNNRPTSGSGYAQASFYTAEQGDGYIPKLVITYTLPEVIPEPASLLFLGFGVVGVAFFRKSLSLQ